MKKQQNTLKTKEKTQVNLLSPVKEEKKTRTKKKETALAVVKPDKGIVLSKQEKNNVEKLIKSSDKAFDLIMYGDSETKTERDIELEPMKPGIYNDLANEEYHRDPAIGSSGLKLLKNPEMYEWTYVKRSEALKRDTATVNLMDFGSAAHTMILETDTFWDRYIVAPEEAKTRSVKAWKEAEKEAEAAGKTALLYKDYLSILGMFHVIRQYPVIMNMLNPEQGYIEQSHFAKDPKTGLMLKARPDKLTSCHTIIDYKTTTSSLGVSDYSRQEFNLERHIQAAFHKRVVELTTKEKVRDVVHIVQMQKPPFILRIFTVPNDTWLERGNMECDYELERLKKFREENRYPSLIDMDITENQQIPELIWPGYADYQIY